VEEGMSNLTRHIHQFHPQELQAATYSAEEMATLSKQLREMVDPLTGMLTIEMPDVCDCGLLCSTFEALLESQARRASSDRGVT
jgi:hypothetical protein